jgi:hypothetical protein
METVTEGVQFDTIAREWRCKWSPDDDKKSLQEAQKVLDEVLEEVKKVDGVKGVSGISEFFVLERNDHIDLINLYSHTCLLRFNASSVGVAWTSKL